VRVYVRVYVRVCVCVCVYARVRAWARIHLISVDTIGATNPPLLLTLLLPVLALVCA